jgi:hypothetical protein
MGMLAARCTWIADYQRRGLFARLFIAEQNKN